MKKIKSLLAIALAVSMCLSLVACSDTADSDEDEGKTNTSVSDNESEKDTDSDSDTEESKTDSEAESKEDESVDIETEPVVLTHDVDLVKFMEDIVSPCIYHKNVETTGKAITDFLQISEKIEANEWGSCDMDLPDDLTFSGVHFSKMYLNADNVGEDSEYVRKILLVAECDPSKTETPEETGMDGYYYNPLGGEIERPFRNAGYSKKGGAFKLNSGCSVEAETNRDGDNIPVSVTLTIYL